MQKIDDFESTPKCEGDTRTYYPNRPLAQTAANRGQVKYQDKGVYSAVAQFEPDKGFVAVLFSEVNIPAAWEEGFEVRLPEVNAKTPADWADKKKPAASNTGTAGVRAPSSGATGKVHAIAQDLVDKGEVSGRADRAKVISACEAAGINKATAATQWSKFAKLKGW